jgi:hypothetical protein
MIRDNIQYPKGFRVDRTFLVDMELWEKFKKYTVSNGLKLNFVLESLIKQYLEDKKKE